MYWKTNRFTTNLEFQCYANRKSIIINVVLFTQKLIL